MPAASLQPRAALSSHGWLSVTKEQGPVQSQPFLRPYAHCLGSHTASCPSVLRVKASARPGQRKVPGAAAPKQPRARVLPPGGWSAARRRAPREAPHWNLYRACAQGM